MTAWIVLGGGSAIDGGQAIALIAQTRAARIFEERAPAPIDASKMLPSSAVPTTGRYGIEVGQAVVITR